MKYIKTLGQLFTLCSVLFVCSICIAANDSTNITTPKTKTTKKSTVLYTLTFVSLANPLTNTKQPCPENTVFVNGSLSQVPYIPGNPLGLTSNGFAWQCTISINAWISPPDPKPTLDFSDFSNTPFKDIEKSMNQLSMIFNNYSSTWKYTGYQFPGNAYIPFAIGGSGIGCVDHSHFGTANCKRSSTGESVNLITADVPQSPNKQYIGYLAPGDSAICNMERTYPQTSYHSCKNTGETIRAGNAWLSKCCAPTDNSPFNPIWNGTTDDPGLRTCYSCP